MAVVTVNTSTGFNSDNFWGPTSGTMTVINGMAAPTSTIAYSYSSFGNIASLTFHLTPDWVFMGMDTPYTGSYDLISANSSTALLATASFAGSPIPVSWTSFLTTFTNPALVRSVTPTLPAMDFAGDDMMTGGAGNDALTAYAGDDTLIGGVGADNLNGGDGIDTASYQTASAGVTANLANPVSNTGDAAGDVYTSIENITGSNFDDLLTGNGVANSIDGGTGADTMAGGAGDDNYFVDDPGDVVIEAAGGGTDTVSTALDTYTLPANVEVLEGASTTGQYLIGNSSDDTIIAGDGPNDIYAGTGSLYAQGGNGGSVIVGSANDDSLYGGVGNDYMVGGFGNDTMVGLGGQDSLYGGPGDDYMVAGNGPGSVVDGGSGSNSLWAGFGDDYMVGGGGQDLIVAGAGSDYLFGNGGDDTLYGGPGTDYIYGNSGNDFIWTDDVGLPQSTDYIYEGGGTGVDTIADFTPGDGGSRDVLVIAAAATGISSFAQIQADTVQVGVYSVINLGGSDQVYLYNVQPFQLTANDFIFT